MASSLDNYLGIHATALNFRAQRANMLASNMANVDTPNYKARDISFENVLQQFQTPSIKSVKTHHSHVELNNTATNSAPIYRSPTKSSLDGNTVDMNTERTAFTENSVRYQASLEFLNKKINGLVRALRGD